MISIPILQYYAFLLISVTAINNINSIIYVFLLAKQLTVHNGPNLFISIFLYVSEEERRQL